MRKFLLQLMLSFVFCSSYGQTVRLPATAIFTRLTTYSGFHAHALSFEANQAALASVSRFSAGLFSERKFLLKEMSLYSGAIVLPAASGSFGGQGSYFGDAFSSETGLGLAYGRKLGNLVSVGVQFNYYSFKLAGYGSASSINAEGGVMIRLAEGLRMGAHVYNPTGSAIGKSGEERLPAIYSMGVGYDVSEKFFVGAEVEKMEDQPVNVQVGLQYYFDEKLCAGAGMASAGSTYYFGLGVLVKNIQLHAVASVHPQLGFTPGLQLLFNRSRANE